MEKKERDIYKENIYLCILIAAILMVLFAPFFINRYYEQKEPPRMEDVK